jgi:hypothetical protein
MLSQGTCQQVGGGNRVLNGKVDPDTTDGGHGVGGVADEQQSRPPPALEPVDPYLEQRYVVPGSSES